MKFTLEIDLDNEHTQAYIVNNFNFLLIDSVKEIVAITKQSDPTGTTNDLRTVLQNGTARKVVYEIGVENAIAVRATVSVGKFDPDKLTTGQHETKLEKVTLLNKEEP